jgi:hypothetical protein
MYFGKRYAASEVLGISTDILSQSYVDRGQLDARLTRLLGRDTHIAPRGESKSRKSWLCQRTVPDAITVQCRQRMTARDLYSGAPR